MALNRNPRPKAQAKDSGDRFLAGAEERLDPQAGKKSGPMIRTLIQLPADQLAEVDQVARKMGMSRSTWLRFAALRVLEEMKR